MEVEFCNSKCPFEPYKVDRGQVTGNAIAIDCETARIDEQRSWLAPPLVLGAAFDGTKGWFLTRETVGPFLKAHVDNNWIFHNASFDLDVLAQTKPDFDVYRQVDRAKVWDTQIMHRLLMLATEGHTARGPGESTLATCAMRYLGENVVKEVFDGQGKVIRVSFGQFLGKPPQEIPERYLQYLAIDTMATLQVGVQLFKASQQLLESSANVWGYVDQDWQQRCCQRWGPLTHHIQLKGAIVLRAISANGMKIDQAAVSTLIPELRKERDRLEEKLRNHHLVVHGKGSQRSLQAAFRRLEQNQPNVRLPRTDSGQYATNADALHDLAAEFPMVQDLLAFRAVDKLLTSFLEKLNTGVIHPTFDVLTRTGRTSSFGELNTQNLPRDDRIRSIFVPTNGHVFLDLDYKTIELVALAQACQSQFKVNSEMGRRINAEEDLHREFAAFVLNKPSSEITNEERAKAKAINFGKPGGMGPRALQDYANVSYNVKLTDTEAQHLSDAWLNMFPEMKEFLANTIDTPHELAVALALTPVRHHEYTGSKKFLRAAESNQSGNPPNRMLGMMCIKVLGHANPLKTTGEAYDPIDIEFLWSCADTISDHLQPKWREALSRREPSRGLQRAVINLCSRAGVFTLTGRLRANATYTAQHNTIFQGLTSDGAKLALWGIWRKGYRIVNFVHDEILLEIRSDHDLTAAAAEIKTIMIAGMREVIPDFRVDVEYAASDRWYKNAKAAFDAAGKLQLWQPKTKDLPPATLTVAKTPREHSPLLQATVRPASTLRFGHMRAPRKRPSWKGV